MRILKVLPYGNSVFFSVRKIDDPIGLLPGRIVLGINKRGVSIIFMFVIPIKQCAPCKKRIMVLISKCLSFGHLSDYSFLKVHFFRPVPKEYLHSAELRDIMQFGSSNSAVFFKMRVAGVLHIFQFETKQV